MPVIRLESDMDDTKVSNLLEVLAQLRKSNQKLKYEIAELEHSKDKLSASHFHQKDEIRSLKNDARSKEQEIIALNQTVQMLEKKLRVPIPDPKKDEIHTWKEKVRVWKEEASSCREEIRILGEGASSQRKEITRLQEKVQKLEKAGAQDSEQITILKQRVHKLEEIAAAESQFAIIGRDVRLRFLEHQTRTGKDPGRIKSGNRAAHRGRPIIDALLFVTEKIEDPTVCQNCRKVYVELYGVSPETMMKWKDVQEIVDVAGFRASLKSERQLTKEFRVPFERLKTLALMVKSSPDLKSMFEADEVNELKKLHVELVDCFDKIASERLNRQGSAAEYSPANGSRFRVS